MRVLRPLSGHPGTVRALSDRLAAQGEHLLTLAETLVGLSGPDVAWGSPSGTAFAARSRPAASLLAAVGRRHGVSAAALRPFAAALEHAQAVVDAAVAEHGDAWPRAVALGNARVEAEQAADPAERARAAGLHVQEVAQLERVQDAERRHAGAWSAFEEADRRCAEVLRHLVEDGLADTRTYDGLTGLSRVASEVEGAASSLALLPTPATKAFGAIAATAGGVTLLSDTAVKVTYGDGDWTAIGLSGAAAAAGPFARVLKVGALATNPAARSATTRAERRRLRHGVGERLEVGAVAELRGFGRSAAKPPARVFRPSPRPGSPVAMAHWAAEQAVERARHAARVKWLDDLALATRDPARSRTMLVAGYGTGAGSTVLDGAAAVREVQLGHREREALQLRDERAALAERDGDGETTGPRRPR